MAIRLKYGLTCLLSILTFLHVDEIAALTDLRFLNMALDDVIFVDDVEFDSPARSKVHCANLCAKFTDCKSFTFTKTASSSSGSCRGYVRVKDAGMALTPLPFSKCYKLKLTTDCGAPPSLTNAGSWGKHTVGSKLSYGCQSYSMPSGSNVNASSVCQADQTWTTPSPPLTCIDCRVGTVLMMSNSGTLYSPGYPGRYANDLNFTIQVTTSLSNVTVAMTYNMEQVSDCTYDFVEFNSDSHLYCGEGSVSKVLAVVNGKWTVRFKTDGSDVKDAGYKIDYY